MKQRLLLGAAVVMALSTAAFAQTANDETVITQVVNTYLAKKDVEAVKHTFSPEARIISVDARGRITETLISKPAARSTGTVVTPLQLVIGVDIAGEGATVKVESDFAPNQTSSPFTAKHIQYISLLKVGGEWKIVNILMPPVRLAVTPDK